MKKFNGPCIQCGKMNDVWFARKLCVACYHKLQRSDDFIPRKKYNGPCVYCNKFEKQGYNYARKLCKDCYTRWHTTGSLEKVEKIRHCYCTNCNLEYSSSGRFVKGLCHKCYCKYNYAKNHPKEPRICIDCNILIKKEKPYVKKRCRNCYRKWKRKTDPLSRELEKQRNKRYESTLKGAEKKRQNVRKRRAILANVESTLTKEEWESILIKFDYKCAYCDLRKKIEMDHVIPISKNGTHTADNVVPACRSCNASKGNKILDKLPFEL